MGSCWWAWDTGLDSIFEFSDQQHNTTSRQRAPFCHRHRRGRRRRRRRSRRRSLVVGVFVVVVVVVVVVVCLHLQLWLFWRRDCGCGCVVGDVSGGSGTVSEGWCLVGDVVVVSDDVGVYEVVVDVVEVLVVDIVEVLSSKPPSFPLPVRMQVLLT